MNTEHASGPRPDDQVTSLAAVAQPLSRSDDFGQYEVPSRFHDLGHIVEERRNARTRLRVGHLSTSMFSVQMYTDPGRGLEPVAALTNSGDWPSPATVSADHRSRMPATATHFDPYTPRNQTLTLRGKSFAAPTRAPKEVTA